MIATVKLIPFGVEAKLRDAAVAVAGKDALRVAPYTIKKVGIVSTLLPGLSPKVIDKTLRVTAERLAPAGATIIAERRVPHDETVLAASIKELLGLGAELVIVFGASAIADRRDVIPAAITEIGGAIEHFGMPVDPGNLLLIGSAGGVPVLGAPGCARSPVENGFDWVLMRLLAGIKVTRADLTGMGVGGLLMEIVTRGQPRSVPDIEGNRNVAAIVLAAGPLDPDGRAEQAARRAQRQEAGADRGRAGAGVESDRSDRRHRPSGRSGRAGACGLEGEVRPQSRFRRRACKLGEGRHCGGGRQGRRRDRLPRRHAADRCAADRPADRGLCARPRPSHHRAGRRRAARQSGAVVAPLLQGIDDARRRYRRAPSDRQARRGGRPKSRSKATAPSSTSTPRRGWKPRGGAEPPAVRLFQPAVHQVETTRA